MCIVVVVLWCMCNIFYTLIHTYNVYNMYILCVYTCRCGQAEPEELERLYTLTDELIKEKPE